MGKNEIKPTILMACGASGGHIFPALAVADELMQAHEIKSLFVLGGQPKFAQNITDAGHRVASLPAAPWSGRNPLKKLAVLWKLWQAYRQARDLIKTEKPKAVLGFGGYATVALVWAARREKVPVVLHEQNAIPGRANRFLFGKADKIALSFAAAEGHIAAKYRGKCVLTGNPVRQNVHIAGKNVREDDETFHLLVQGGSLGARYLSDIVPNALDEMTEGELIRTHVVHQARPEDVSRVEAAYKRLGLAGYEVKSFYEDMPARLIWSHLTIGRAGAGTLAELALLGRAAILIPHRLADHHQKANAKVFADDNAAVLMEEPDTTPTRLAEEIEVFYRDWQSGGGTRTNMQDAAKKLAVPDAAAQVAKVVVSLTPPVSQKSP